MHNISAWRFLNFLSIIDLSVFKLISFFLLTVFVSTILKMLNLYIDTYFLHITGAPYVTWTPWSHWRIFSTKTTKSIGMDSSRMTSIQPDSNGPFWTYQRPTVPTAFSIDKSCKSGLFFMYWLFNWKQDKVYLKRSSDCKLLFEQFPLWSSTNFFRVIFKLLKN